jgi:hypothetical protein
MFLRRKKKASAFEVHKVLDDTLRSEDTPVNYYSTVRPSSFVVRKMCEVSMVRTQHFLPLNDTVQDTPSL